MVYSKEKVVNQFTKLDAFAGAKTNAAIVEWELAKVHPFKSRIKKVFESVKAASKKKKSHVSILPYYLFSF